MLLDHGVYVEVDDVLREQFCQLWCAIVRSDERTQTDLAAAMGGERAGKVLPVLLTHKARTREEERELQRKVGINNFGDMTQVRWWVGRCAPACVHVCGVGGGWGVGVFGCARGHCSTPATHPPHPPGLRLWVRVMGCCTLWQCLQQRMLRERGSSCY